MSHIHSIVMNAEFVQMHLFLAILLHPHGILELILVKDETELKLNLSALHSELLKIYKFAFYQGLHLPH